MVESLIRWLKKLNSGYTLSSNHLTLSNKWYAEDATLIASTVTDLNTQLDTVNIFSEGSGIRLNISKCRLTGYIHALQLIKRKADQDVSLQARLANVRVGGTSIPIISQDDPLPGDYLGTALSASLCPKAHLAWTSNTLAIISKAILSTPLPPGIKQRLLLYRANSKIMHTHSIMTLSPNAIAAIDSKLEATCRKIWNLPKGFPRADLHAPHDELGLNPPTIWEDYCSAATNSWTQILNYKGALGAKARASLYSKQQTNSNNGRRTCLSSAALSADWCRKHRDGLRRERSGTSTISSCTICAYGSAT
jgi:hypothetical protein